SERSHLKPLLAIDPVTVEVDLSFTRVEQACHHIEHSGLASSVRPNQREDLTLVDGELQPVHSDHTAKSHRYSSHLEERAACRGDWSVGHALLTSLVLALDLRLRP